MGQEIERKWRVRTLPKDYYAFPCKEMEQAYLCVNPTLRIRKEILSPCGTGCGVEQREEYIFCYKGKGRLSREEYNLPLTKEAYESLLGKIEGRVIRTSRYEIPCGKYTVELDVFQGELEGLCYAEVEFSSLEEAKAFQPLDWFSEELTEERGYSNAELSFAKDLSNLKLKD